ncbi:MAG: toxin YoeB, partial [Sulfuricurvum sp. RIFCSPLOWO2_02_43_6]
MMIAFSTKGWEDYLYWQHNDKKILKRINALLEDIRRNPDEGLGKPERLKENLSGY